MDKKQSADALCAAAIGFGVVGLLAPRTLAKVIGVPAESGEVVASLRMIATRNIALGLVPRVVDVSDYGPFLTVAALMNGADSLLSFAAGASGKVNKRGAFTLSLLTAGLAAMAAMPVLQDN